MKITNTKNLPVFLIIILMVFSSCCDSLIEEYKPNNQDEREILSLLIQYQRCKKSFGCSQK